LALDLNISRIADFYEEFLENSNHKPGDPPPLASLEFSINGSCTRRCHFCPRVDEKLFKNDKRSLDFGLFTKVIDELSADDYQGRISFSGFTEPLMTVKLNKYIAYARKMRPNMTIEMVTNGDLLTESVMTKLFDAGLNNMRISLYDGPEQEAIFRDMANKLGYSDKQVICRPRYLSAEESFGITITNRAGSISLKEGSVDISPLNEPMSKSCYIPFSKMLINHDGNALICQNDFLSKNVIGNVADDTIKELLLGERFDDVRKHLLQSSRDVEPCKTCDVHGRYNGEAFFVAWKDYYDCQN